MIGIRNPKSTDPNNQWLPDDGQDKCVEVWVNELRLVILMRVEDGQLSVE